MPQDFHADLEENLLKAESAIKAVEAGVTDEQLRRAPILDLWLPGMFRDAPCLWGQVQDHPVLGRDDIISSPLVGLDVDRGWARSCSRWYRLGRPFFKFQHDLCAHLNGAGSSGAHVMFEFPGFHPIENLEIAQEEIAEYVALVRERCTERGGS